MSGSLSRSSLQSDSLAHLKFIKYHKLKDKGPFYVELWSETLDHFIIPERMLSIGPFMSCIPIVTKIMTKLLKLKHEFIIIYLGNNRAMRVDYGRSGEVEIKIDQLDKLVIYWKGGQKKLHLLKQQHLELNDYCFKGGEKTFEAIAKSLQPEQPYHLLLNNCHDYAQSLFRFLTNRSSNPLQYPLPQ